MTLIATYQERRRADPNDRDTDFKLEEIEANTKLFEQGEKMFKDREALKVALDIKIKEHNCCAEDLIRWRKSAEAGVQENVELRAELAEVKAERDALKAHAELRYTAFQSPHNDDRWLEHPADSEIIDEFDPPVHVGFEYELTAGSYTTQRYRVTKIADDESDDVEVELIATIQGAGK